MNAAIRIGLLTLLVFFGGFGAWALKVICLLFYIK